MNCKFETMEWNVGRVDHQIKLFSFRRRSRQRYLYNYFSENTLGNIWTWISQLLIWVSFGFFVCAHCNIVIIYEHYLQYDQSVLIKGGRGKEERRWNTRLTHKCVEHTHIVIHWLWSTQTQAHANTHIAICCKNTYSSGITLGEALLLTDRNEENCEENFLLIHCSIKTLQSVLTPNCRCVP